MSTNPKYSVVIPVYNTENSLIELVNRIRIVFKSIGTSYEVIFVDDGSSNPNTWSILEKLTNEDRCVQAIRLMRNFGQQEATICGIQTAIGEFVITMDDDLQHLPEDIPNLIKNESHDVVIGQFKGRKHSLFKRLSSKIKGYFDQIILGKPRHIQLSPFRLINRATIEGMKPLFHTPYPFLPAILFYVTKDFAGVDVSHARRHEGKTGYNFIKMMKMFSNLVINNSSFLLTLIGNIGLSISILSFALGIYFVYRKVFYSASLIGWTSVIVTILFIGGLLLFSIGIMGEYLVRIIRGLDGRPNYIVRKHLRNDVGN